MLSEWGAVYQSDAHGGLPAPRTQRDQDVHQLRLRARLRHHHCHGILKLFISWILE